MNFAFNHRTALRSAVVSSCLLLVASSLGSDDPTATEEIKFDLQPQIEISDQVIQLSVAELLPDECNVEDQCFFTVNPDSSNGTLLVVYNPDSEQHYIAKWRDDSPVQTPIASSFNIAELVECTHCVGSIEIEDFQFDFLMDAQSEFVVLPPEHGEISNRTGVFTAFAEEFKDVETNLELSDSSQ